MIEVHRTASKHGVRSLDIMHAVEHEPTSFDLEPHTDPPKILTIGPDRAGNLLEVIMLELSDKRLLVIHAMKLRSQFNDLLPSAKGKP